MVGGEKLIFAPGNNLSDSPSPPPSSDSHTQKSGGKGTESQQEIKEQKQPKPGQAAQFQSQASLRQSHLHPNPILQFHKWFTHPSLRSHVPETCTLSTAHLPSGRVSSRMVYLKELELNQGSDGTDPNADGAFVIYSNFSTSRKAYDMQTNPHVSLCFWWKPLERQVRVEGKASRLTPEESQKYFDTRVRGSKIGAWASRQSEILEPMDRTKTAKLEREEGGGGNGEGVMKEEDDGRAQLENQVSEVERRYHDEENIPVPPFWGGLRVIPDTIEFWQGRDNRLHDRFRYSRVDRGNDEDGKHAEWKQKQSQKREEGWKGMKEENEVMKDEKNDTETKWKLERLSP